MKRGTAPRWRAGIMFRLALLLAGMSACLFPGRAAAPYVAISVWLPGFAEYREAMTRDFQAEYPEIRLKLVCQATGGYQSRLMEALVGVGGPDLFLAELTDLGSLAEAGLCEPLDRYLVDLRGLAAVSPAFPRLLVFGGKTRGLPVTGHPLALFVRQDWLTRLNLTPPTTWDELALVATAFTKKDPDGNGKDDTYGLAERWPAQDPTVATRFLPWLYQAGGLVATYQNGKWQPGFGQSAGVKALRFLRRLWETGLLPPGAPDGDAARSMALFCQGVAGMVIEDDRQVAAVRQALGARVTAVPLPRDIRMCTVGDGLCFAVSSRSNSKTAACAFIQWWISREVQEKFILGWDRRPGGVGVNAGPLVLGPRQDVDPAALLAEPLYAGFVRSFPYMSPEPYFPKYVLLRPVIARAVSAAMGPEKTVEEALAAGMGEAGAVLAQ